MEQICKNSDTNSEDLNIHDIGMLLIYMIWLKRGEEGWGGTSPNV